MLALPVPPRGNASVVKSPATLTPDNLNVELLPALGQCLGVSIPGGAPVPQLPDDDFCLNRLKSAIIKDPMGAIETLASPMDFACLNQLQEERRKFVMGVKECTSDLLENQQLVKKHWDRHSPTSLSAYVAKWLNRGGVTFTLNQMLGQPIRLCSGFKTVDKFASKGFCPLMSYIYWCDFCVRNGIDAAAIDFDIVLSSQDAWDKASNLNIPENARGPVFIREFINSLKGASTNSSSSSSSSQTTIPTPTILSSTPSVLSSPTIITPPHLLHQSTFPKPGEIPWLDTLTKAIENLARHVGIKDSSIPALAQGITSNGAPLPQLIIQLHGRHCLSKFYTLHPNAEPHPSSAAYASNMSETGSQAGGSRGGRGRGGFGGRGRGGNAGGNTNQSGNNASAGGQ